MLKHYRCNLSSEIQYLQTQICAGISILIETKMYFRVFSGDTMDSFLEPMEDHLLFKRSVESPITEGESEIIRRWKEMVETSWHKLIQKHFYKLDPTFTSANSIWVGEASEGKWQVAYFSEVEGIQEKANEEIQNIA